MSGCATEKIQGHGTDVQRSEEARRNGDRKTRIRSRKTEERDRVKMSQKRRTWKISENNEVITKQKSTETEIKHGKMLKTET